ncbi:hypothetical protein FQZ97_975350 [compost metagenome]
MHRHAEHLGTAVAVEPALVDRRHAVARIEDQVDERVTVVHLREPVRIGELRAPAVLLHQRRDALEVLAQDEQVQVLRHAADAGVAGQRESTAHQERNARIAQRAQAAPIEVGHLGRDFFLERRGERGGRWHA